MEKMRGSFRVIRAAACAALLLGAPGVLRGASPMSYGSPQGETKAGASSASAATSAPGIPFTAEKVSSLLPATVYFAGRTAPLQTRNAGGTVLPSGILWISLVDSSGYSTSVQERYQFYFVTEGPVHVGDVALKAGAYGGGFVGDHFVLMDLGDHTVGEGATQNDTEMRRPRPLQVVGDQPNTVKLYLGRRWVVIRADASSAR